jgi:hypothetical protein
MRTDSATSETAWIPFPSAEYAGRSLLEVSGAAGVGLLLAGLGLWLLRSTGNGARAAWLATWAFAPFLVALVVSVARPIFLDRYLVVAAPAFALLAAVAVLGVSARWRFGLAGTAAAATAVGLVLWYESAEDGNWKGEDWRSAAATVLERSNEADAVLVVPWWAHDAAEYYGAPAADVSTADSIWVLHWSEDGPAIPAEVRGPLGFGDHELVESRQFGWRLSAQLWRRSK